MSKALSARATRVMHVPAVGLPCSRGTRYPMRRLDCCISRDEKAENVLNLRFQVDLHGLHVEEGLARLEHQLLCLGGLAADHPEGLTLRVIVGAQPACVEEESSLHVLPTAAAGDANLLLCCHGFFPQKSIAGGPDQRFRIGRRLRTWLCEAGALRRPACKPQSYVQDIGETWPVPRCTRRHGK